jgi:DUF2934 family protein
MNGNGFREAKSNAWWRSNNMKKHVSRNQTDRSEFTKEQPISMPDNGTWQLIALQAYKLYEQRGREEGHALEDWLKAEAIIRGVAS